jgi:hypothetical protein
VGPTCQPAEEREGGGAGGAGRVGRKWEAGPRQKEKGRERKVGRRPVGREREECEVCFFSFFFKSFLKPTFKPFQIQIFTQLFSKLFTNLFTIILKDFSQILLKTFKTTQQQNSCIST